MLMWALRSSMYLMGWQFSFNGQLNWSAAEANWRLVMVPLAATNYEIVEAACFVGEHRGGRPGAWADDVYTGVSWADVCMTAQDQQDSAEAERDDPGDDDLEVNTQAPDDPPDVSDEPAYLEPRSQRVSYRLSSWALSWSTIMKMAIPMMTKKHGRLLALLLLVRHRRIEPARRTRWHRSRAKTTRVQITSAVVGPGMWMARRLWDGRHGPFFCKRLLLSLFCLAAGKQNGTRAG